MGRASKKNTIFRVLRYDPERDRSPHYDKFEVPLTPGLTVLDALIYIKENLDNSLAYRASCRMGVCGSCGMMINGFPRLACQTQVKDLKSKTIKVEPLPNYPQLKDLVPNLDPLFERHRLIKPYIVGREETDTPSLEYIQYPDELEAYLQFSYCIKCGICLSACPTFATDSRFLGPQALASAYRYIVDTRDNGANERVDVVDRPHGVWRCHFAGACTEACPKGVDPALASQLLKKTILFKNYRKKRLASVSLPVKEAKPRQGIPKAPEPTVK
jgi:succinate dehydrogenase / fumarate reductase iron-sulfur subunit